MELKITDQDLQDAQTAQALVDFIKAAAGLKCDHCLTRTERIGGVSVTVTGTAEQVAEQLGDDDDTVWQLAEGHGSPEPDADAAKLEALAGQGAAGPTAAEIFSAPFVPSTAGVGQSSTAPAAPPATLTAPPAPPAPAPTPAAVAAALSAPAAPSSPADVDSRGMPWDARIHAKNRATVADGSWRKAKGVDAALIAQVEAELCGTSPAPRVAPPPPASFEDQLRRVTAGPLPPPPPAPTAGGTLPPPPAAPAAKLPDLSDVILVITSGGMSEAEYLPALQSVGAVSVPDLATKPHLIPGALTALRALRPAA